MEDDTSAHAESISSEDWPFVFSENFFDNSPATSYEEGLEDDISAQTDS